MPKVGYFKADSTSVVILKGARKLQKPSTHDHDSFVISFASRSVVPVKNDSDPSCRSLIRRGGSAKTFLFLRMLSSSDDKLNFILHKF